MQVDEKIYAILRSTDDNAEDEGLMKANVYLVHCTGCGLAFPFLTEVAGDPRTRPRYRA